MVFFFFNVETLLILCTHFNLPVNCILSKIFPFYFASYTVCLLYKSFDCKLDKEIPTVIRN